jgi:C4-dicarboxylate-specific signal transduction histidine kinase
MRETGVLALGELGDCTLSVVRPIDAQTQRLAALGFMLAGVCHEVSNPLAAIHSMLQILQSKRGVSRETLDKGLASIGGNIARVLAITRKLGDFSRVGGEQAVPVSIDGAMDAATALLRHSDQAPGVTLDYRGAGGAKVPARPGQLEQVLFNLLLNAAQAMSGKGGIEVEVRREGPCAVIAIRDAGPGIPPEHLARVFEPFFSTKPAGEGLGLGLAICNEIAQELGGTLHADNHPQGGACFELTLPLAP